MRNMGLNVIEDIKVNVDPVNKKNVEIKLNSLADIPKLDVQQISVVEVIGEALKGVKAGLCRFRINIKCMLTEE